MEKQILEFLAKNPKHAWSPREVGRHLKVATNERRELRATLKALAEKGRVFRYRGNRYVSRDKSLMVEGNLKVHFEGYGFVISENPQEPDVFIPAKYMNYALPGDRVLVTYHEKKEDKRREGRIIQILGHGRTHWIGVLEQRGRSFYVMNHELVTSIEILIPRTHLNFARIGQTVAVKASQYPGPNRPMLGEVVEVLGSPHDEKTETAAILVRHNIPRSFPQNVQQEVDRIEDKILDEEIERRVDLRHLPIFTIDGIDARDFDDAVYVEKKGSYFHLYVSIADVAHYLLSGSTVDKEAIARATSVYFPDFVVPMLPEKLSNNLCSLKPGQDRLTLTCEIKFDSTGKPLEAWYYESVIRSIKRGIYEEVQAFFDGASFSVDDYKPELQKNLRAMKNLADILLKSRERRGVLDFDLPEAQVIYNNEGQISAIKKTERFFSHRLIEEFMIAANIAVAEVFSRLHLPCLYRIHDQPDSVKVAEFLTIVRHLGVKLPKPSLKKPKDFAHLLDVVRPHPMEPLIHQMLLRAMKIAIYDPDNRGHFGLNLKNYCHFTSPIRRYPDLVVHRQLKNLIRTSHAKKLHLDFTLKKKPASKHKKTDIFSIRPGLGSRGSLKSFYSPDDMDYLGEVSSKREREAVEAEREMMHLKRALFMQDHIGNKFFGTVRRIAKFGMFVELEPYYVEGLLHVSELVDDYYRYDDKRIRFVARRNRKKTFKVGDKIWVRVKDVSVDERKVSLEMVV